MEKVRSVCKLICKRIFKTVKILIAVYILYRVVNLLIVEAVYNIRKDEITAVANSGINWYTNFEYPAPMINDCVDYELLAWRYKVFISEEEYAENKDYVRQAKTINMANILLPWTSSVVIPRYDERHHCYGEYDGVGLDIYVTGCKPNVFTLEPEETFWFV